MSCWLLWCLVSCVSRTERSAFASTRELCGWSFARFGAENAWQAPRYPSEACVDRVLSDLSADVDALLEADSLLDPYGLVYGDDLSGTRTRSLLSGMYLLQIVDLGEVRDLPEGGWTGGDFAEALRESAEATGERSISGALYDRISERIALTQPGPLAPRAPPGADAAMTPDRSLIWELTSGTGFDAAGLLAHETRHVDGLGHIRCAPGGAIRCDRGSGGAIGFQIALHILLREASADDSLADELSARVAALARDIR